MALDADVQQIIAKIDQRIERLRRIRTDLIEEFGLPARPQAPVNGAVTHLAPPSNVPRRQVITKFLQTNGPASRREIVAATGIPEGTVSGVLNEDAFVNQDGKWRLKAHAAE